ncbi:aminopeptidase N [Kribbella sancticallisti]|uniref:Aminopeptidase N n=1 Tax=Kribbella sancticallisti TaxID=460087 RepID=A0ABN2DK31_9ACTN
MTLTADEARQRCALITVSHYDLRFDLGDFADTGAFRARSVVRFLCDEPGASTWIDLVSRTVDRVQLNGVELDPSAVVHGERVELPGLSGYNVLLVESTHDAGSGRGLSRSVDSSDGTVYAWTQFQPYDARRAFACFDQPDLKAPFTISAVVPRAWTCVSNGVACLVADNSRTRTWTFTETPPLATYVVALCAGAFHVVSGHADDVTIRLHARQSLAALLERDAGELIDLTRQGLEFFGREFGLPYPSVSYDYVFLPDQPGAMENFGCVTWGDGALYRSAPTDAQRARRTSVLLHEMAHMWFGNLVTPAWWDGLWLNESFATWAGTWAACSLAGSTDPWMRFLMTREARAYSADESVTSHPIAVEIVDVDAAEANFDMVTYVKGASVLRQLVAWVGEAQFVDGLRRYFKRYAWQSADLGALLDEVGQASGRDLRAWADEWLYRAGVNTLEVVAPVRAGRYGEVSVRQYGGGGPRPHRIGLGIYDNSSGDALELRETIELDLTAPTSTVKALASARPAAVLLPNDGNLTFAKVRLDDTSARGLIAGAHTLPTSLSRAVALTALRGMVFDGQLAAADLVRVAMRCVLIDPDAAAVSQLLAVAVEAATVFSPAHARDEALQEVAGGCVTAYAAGTDTEMRRTLALGLAQSATSEEQLAALQELLPTADESLRWAALTRLAALGRLTEDMVVAQLDRDPKPDTTARAAAVRAACPETAAKAAALERILGDRQLPVSIVRQLADALWQPGQEDLLRPFAAQYLAALPELLADTSSASLRNIVGHTFPSFGIDDEFLERARRIEARLDAPLAARNSLTDKLWFIEGVLRARKVQRAPRGRAAAPGPA